LIVDPHGTILADAGETEGVIRAELDIPMLLKYREGLPFLADMRS
jgi:predicted amidohydrolase